MPQFDHRGIKRTTQDTKILGIIIILGYIFFVFIVLNLWLFFLPQMEEAGRETANMISGNGTITIIQSEIIPEIRLLLPITVFSFGVLDGCFSFMLFKGFHRQEHRMLIIPFFTMFLLSRIASGIIVSFLTSMALLSADSRMFMNILYMTILIVTFLDIVIILLLYDKVFTSRKKTEAKVIAKGSQGTP